MLSKLIITPHKTKEHKEIETLHLLEKGETNSIPLLRKALENLNLENRLILVSDKNLAKIFKSDYGYNDHGIYYDLENDFRITEENIERIYKKENKLYVSKPLPEEHETEYKCFRQGYLDSTRLNSVVVFMERSTSKRDYERFLNYDEFIDPVKGYVVNRDWENYTLNPEGEFILDIETTGLDFTQDELLLLSVKEVGSQELLVLENPSVEDVKSILKGLIGRKVIGHNLIFDISWLMYFVGLEFCLEWHTVDTMLLAHVAGERRLSLKHLSMMYGNFKGRRNTLNANEAYLVEDMLTTELLYKKFENVYNSFAGRLVCEAVKTFSETKVNGVELDQKRLFEIRDSYKHLEKPKYDFNVNSNKELADYFLSQGVQLDEKTPSGSWKIDKNALGRLANKYECVREYLDYKNELNIYQKYILPYCNLESFTIRPNIKLFGTETGRLSCSDPNVQQIPNKSLFKDIFRSRFEKGLIATIDLDRAELGIAALLSNDDDYVEALLSEDFHRLIASMTFEKPFEEVTKQERFVAKAVNFGGVLYGGSAKGIAFRIGVESEVVAKVQKWYKKGFPVLTEWIENQKQQAKYTYQITTFFGRKRIFYNLRPDEVERRGVNTAVQSVASDVMTYIVTRLGSLLRDNKMQSKILFPVHDELLLDIHPEELNQVAELLKSAFKDVLKTPLGKLELSQKLPISGTLEYADSWLYLKSDDYKAKGEIFISSL